MPELHYPKPYVFSDSRRNREYTGPGTFDVPEDAVEQYLSRGWTRPESDENTDVAVEDEHQEDAETVYDAAAKPAESGTADDVAATAPEDVDDVDDVVDEPPEPPADETADATVSIVTESDDVDADSVDAIEYGNLTVNELKEVLNDRAAQLDAARLRTLIEHEKGAKNRKGALKALRAHLDEKTEE